MAKLWIEGDYLIHDHIRVARLLPGVNASDKMAFETTISEEPKDPTREVVQQLKEALSHDLDEALDDAHGLLSSKEIEEIISKCEV